MRIDIEPSARDHLITDAEIRAVITYPELRLGLVARRPNADLTLYVGRADDNQPHIEVIADRIAPEHLVAFHAMMLRRKLVAQLRLDAYLTPDFAPQRRKPRSTKPKEATP
ncbi:hypothetical protein [Mycobacterium sp. EPa45]|uniref:hypothetical protein n=1 Tax=Mycobacterium sp. EPa45 TaxID=1545728 RepID=UPI000641DAD1|nr:hypothetical protein [Mycobacterium sp. EPa45]AKK27334.1 hypothetical protein AB431_12315 [Mycobacterium sp. EPa45]